MTVYSFTIEVEVPDDSSHDAEWCADACVGALSTFYGLRSTYTIHDDLHPDYDPDKAMHEAAGPHCRECGRPLDVDKICNDIGCDLYNEQQLDAS